MKQYSKQKNKTLYSQESYDHKSRFISYFNQKRLILKYLKKMPLNSSILEIGVGSKFTYNYLTQQCGIKNIKTFDFAKDLKPDYLGSITEASKIVNKKFNLVCCFEVLEHIEYSDAVKSIEQLSKITIDKLIISIPQSTYHIGAWLSASKLGSLGVLLALQSRKKHHFNGEHYWEIGKRKTSISKLRKAIELYFTIDEEYVDTLDVYHRFFICTPKQ